MELGQKQLTIPIEDVILKKKETPPMQMARRANKTEEKHVIKKHDCPNCVYWMGVAACLKKKPNGDDCPFFFTYDDEKKPKIHFLASDTDVE